MNSAQRIKFAARAGITDPLIFGIALISLTILKYNFLLSLGWHPLRAPTFDWPSGLALGEYGWIMTATFILSGLMMILFASGLYLSLFPIRLARIGTLLLAFAGLALMGLAFITDPTLTTTVRSWHGLLHDSSFVLLGLTFPPAMILLGFAFRHDRYWNNLSYYTWTTVALALPTFWLKGAAFYIFLLAVLIWCEVIAFRLSKHKSHTI
ncbi:MAG TPA: DUF998 domain-containing protein [Anaerolineales bacterium]|nr:DUF998 domain-containing protein [Anaerolineales bacterium]